nr:hypothetical protein [Bacillus infantis]
MVSIRGHARFGLKRKCIQYQESQSCIHPFLIGEHGSLPEAHTILAFLKKDTKAAVEN